MLHGGQLLGVADEPGIDPLLVALTPGLHLLDVRVGLALLAREILDRGLGLALRGRDVGTPLGQRRERGELGHRTKLVGQLVEMRVDVLQIEQLQLGEWIGFHRGAP